MTHLALRLSDKVYNVPGAIHPHMLVSCRHVAVWLPGKVRRERWGKPDRGLARFLVDTLNCQIEAGHPTYLFLIDPDPGSRLMYSSKLQGVSPQWPAKKDLVPGFYREMKLLARMKAWLKIGDLHGYRLDKQPRVEEANRQYAQMEEKVLRRGPASWLGYFLLDEEQV